MFVYLFLVLTVKIHRVWKLRLDNAVHSAITKTEKTVKTIPFILPSGRNKVQISITNPLANELKNNSKKVLS